jgi:aspartate 1-decarboxylase
MEAAGLIAGEKVLVANLTTGSRFETYLIEGRHGSCEVCVNGAAAHLARPGDTIIIMAFKFVPEDEASTHQPVLVYLDRKNKIVRLKKEHPREKEIISLD